MQISMRVLDLPDGQLKEIDPWSVVAVIREEMLRVKPHVVVTFPVHGSGDSTTLQQRSTAERRRFERRHATKR